MKLQIVSIAAAMLLTASVYADDWSQEQVFKIPGNEVPVSLFNGKDLDGWEGFTDKYLQLKQSKKL